MEVGVLKSRADIEPSGAKVESARDVGYDALTATTHTGHAQPHVPVPLLSRETAKVTSQGQHEEEKRERKKIHDLVNCLKCGY